mmetsp:Transcript_11476/g.25263  ORF Transcript_11476/g.25263 Transcript_11476/m.25263 type:complete len:265 (-) Transcript_11476:409-1203(-)
MGVHARQHGNVMRSHAETSLTTSSIHPRCFFQSRSCHLDAVMPSLVLFIPSKTVDGNSIVHSLLNGMTNHKCIIVDHNSVRERHFGSSIEIITMVVKRKTIRGHILVIQRIVPITILQLDKMHILGRSQDEILQRMRMMQSVNLLFINASITHMNDMMSLGTSLRRIKGVKRKHTRLGMSHISRRTIGSHRYHTKIPIIVVLFTPITRPIFTNSRLGCKARKIFRIRHLQQRTIQRQLVELSRTRQKDMLARITGGNANWIHPR